MREFTVNTAAEHFDVAALEILQAFLERMQFRRANKSEVQRVKHQDDVFFALETGELNFGESGANGGLGFEVWG
jgi:hypothetical protein